MQFAEVAVSVPNVSKGTFTYRVPKAARVQPGDVVWVPFGPRLVQGIVFKLSNMSLVEGIRYIERWSDTGPYLWRHQLDLAKWIAKYYRVDLFTAAALMLPPGTPVMERTWIRHARAESPRIHKLSQRDERAISYVPERDHIRRDRLINKLGPSGRLVVDRLLRIGVLESSSVWQEPNVRPLYRQVVLPVGDATAMRSAAEQERGKRAPRRAEALEWLAANPTGGDMPHVVSLFGRSPIKRLIEMGLARRERRRVERDPLKGRIFQQQSPYSPTIVQSDAIEKIVETLPGAIVSKRSLNAGRFLLFGVTGSGKTEVYMQAAATCLASGKGVIVMVPEIALTPQTLNRFEGRFPGKVALLHSGLTRGQRYDQWWRIRDGKYSIVLGSRNAIFAPVADPGLVVIDEEHDWTYKQTDRAPRFHTLTVAERFSELTGAAVVAGSATPDVVSFRRAQRGDLTLLRLPARITGGEQRQEPAHATAHIVDMRDELRAGRTGILSQSLERAMRETLEAGDRVILFLNRRGTASFVQCRDCGGVRHCRRCDMSLTYHRGDTTETPARLVCHYCNYRVKAKRACFLCGGQQVRRVGAGTQAVVEAVRQRLPGIGVIRWDRDAARSLIQHEAILEEFLTGDARVLVGTQMVAKGLDIPSVTLVGIISADTGLNIPDYTACERTYQVIAQVAGRAGRGSRKGQVVIQTMQPDQYAIVLGANQDYEAFYKAEIGRRYDLGYPPFARLIRLVHAGIRPASVRGEADEFAARLRQGRDRLGETGTEIIGPTPAFPMRLRGLTRWQIVLKGANPARLLDSIVTPEKWSIDVDPVSFT